jgi:hypothetical protein
MARTDSARANPRRKKKHVSPRAAASRANGGRKADVRPVETAPEAAAPASRLERTRRLILAALRVWELKRKIRD